MTLSENDINQLRDLGSYPTHCPTINPELINSGLVVEVYDSTAGRYEYARTVRANEFI